MPRKRTKFQREDDLVQIADLHLRGVRQVEIARRFGLSKAQICKDLAAVHARWRETSKPDLETIKCRQLTKLEMLQKMHWEAWEVSQRPKEIVSKKQISTPGTTDGQEQADRERNEASIRTEERDGSVAFLKEVRECIKMECEIHGLTGRKVELTGSENGPPIQFIEVRRPPSAPPPEAEATEAARESAPPPDEAVLPRGLSKPPPQETNQPSLEVPKPYIPHPGGLQFPS
jgi:hypothetical protein